ncbi:MAG: hypothetical protein WC441_01705 [Patescibacteria group bacterium]
MKSLWVRIFQTLVFVLSFGSFSFKKRGRVQRYQYLSTLCLLLWAFIATVDVYLVVRYFQVGSYLPVLIAVIPSIIISMLIGKLFARHLESLDDNFGMEATFIIGFYLVFYILIVLFGVYLLLAELTGFFPWCSWFFSNYWLESLLIIPLFLIYRSRFYLSVLLRPLGSLKRVARIMEKIAKQENQRRLDFFYWRLSKSRNLLFISMVLSDLILNKYHEKLGRDYRLFRRFSVLLINAGPDERDSIRPIFITTGSYSQTTAKLLACLRNLMKEGSVERKLEVPAILEIVLNFLGAPKEAKDHDMLRGFLPFRDFINSRVFAEYVAIEEFTQKEAAKLAREKLAKLLRDMNNGDVESFLFFYSKYGINLLGIHREETYNFFECVFSDLSNEPTTLFHYSREKRQAFWGPNLDLFFMACRELYRSSHDDALLAWIKRACKALLTHMESFAASAVNPASITRLCKNKRDELNFL